VLIPRVLASALAACTLSTLAAERGAAAATNGFATYQPATVEPPVSRPAARHCTVVLYREHGFVGERPFHAPYAPPTVCRGPWSKVILTVDTHVKGNQYDRIGSLWLGRDEIFRFSTAEPTRHGIFYRVEKDVTPYIPLLRSPQTVRTDLVNYVTGPYDGVFYLTASLTFYEASAAAPAARVADAVLPVTAAPGAPTTDRNGHFSATLSHLPANVVRATLDLYASNHACDEFWYTNVPDAYAARHKKDELCGGGPYREIDVAVDGRLASVVYPFPYIWTGGINPLLWRPLSAIHTLNVPPYAVDLDPWAGVLSDGKPHTITVSVYNDRGSWFVNGNLMLWTDHGGAHTSGAVTADTIAAKVPESTIEMLGADGGTFRETASRAWHVAGYVDTSRGRVRYAVADTMRFMNAQTIVLSTGRGDATQQLDFTRTMTTTDGTGTHVRTESESYTLIANSVYPPPAKRPGYDLVIDADVHQSWLRHGTDGRCAFVVDATAELKRKGRQNVVARGRTSEGNACTGAYGRYAISASSVDGVPR